MEGRKISPHYHYRVPESPLQACPTSRLSEKTLNAKTPAAETASPLAQKHMKLFRGD